MRKSGFRGRIKQQQKNTNICYFEKNWKKKVVDPKKIKKEK